ncbi:hypothetical protein Hanom_Chr14g01317961 [Helianthus anomalus]
MRCRPTAILSVGFTGFFGERGDEDVGVADLFVGLSSPAPREKRSHWVIAKVGVEGELR